MNWGAISFVALCIAIGSLCILECVLIFGIITARMDLREARQKLLRDRQRLLNKMRELGIAPDLVESDHE